MIQHRFKRFPSHSNLPQSEGDLNLPAKPYNYESIDFPKHPVTNETG
ncbi:MAG: hypothetical protein ACI9XO_002010 [Paraglaciecola sp.]|jgi:hypothetical protein